MTRELVASYLSGVQRIATVHHQASISTSAPDILIMLKAITLMEISGKARLMVKSLLRRASGGSIYFSISIFIRSTSSMSISNPRPGRVGA